jgi:hypothetical protein
VITRCRGHGKRPEVRLKGDRSTMLSEHDAMGETGGGGRSGQRPGETAQWTSERPYSRVRKARRPRSLRTRMSDQRTAAEVHWSKTYQEESSKSREAALASSPSSRTSRTKPGSHVKAPPHVPGERG